MILHDSLVPINPKIFALALRALPETLFSHRCHVRVPLPCNFGSHRQRRNSARTALTQIILGILSDDLRASQRLPSTRELARRFHLHLQNRWMLTGAVAGAGTGLAAGGIADATRGTNYLWLAGGFGGAIFGYFVCYMALAATGGIEVARDHRREKINLFRGPSSESATRERTHRRT